MFSTSVVPIHTRDGPSEWEAPRLLTVQLVRASTLLCNSMVQPPCRSGDVRQWLVFRCLGRKQ